MTEAPTFPTLPEYPAAPNYASGYTEPGYLDSMRRVDDQRIRLLEAHHTALSAWCVAAATENAERATAATAAQTSAIAANTAANLEAGARFAAVLAQFAGALSAPEAGSGMSIDEVFQRIKDAEDRIKAAMLAAIREAEPGVAPT